MLSNQCSLLRYTFDHINYSPFFIFIGRDFEKVARWNTIFHYNPYTGGRDTHETFWNGREFEVLLLMQCKKKANSNAGDSNIIWTKGKFVSWLEYNMGPGDRFVKWRLTANILPQKSLGVGSLVCPTEATDILAIITKIDEDGKICTIKHEDGTSSDKYELSKLRSYDGELDFDVHRLNVQGGGILKCDRLNKILGVTACGLSLKWSAAVSEREEDCDLQNDIAAGVKVPGIAHGGRRISKRIEDGNCGGCWFFDFDQRDMNLSSVARVIFVSELRREHIKMIKDGDVMTFFKYLQNMLVGRMSVSHNFHKGLLSVPFNIYEDIVDYFFAIFNMEAEIDDAEVIKMINPDMSITECQDIFHTMARVGIYLRNDEDCHVSTLDIEGIIRSKSPFLGGRVVGENDFDVSLCRILNKVGEFFEKHLEFRAAVWCYSQNLRSVPDPNTRFSQVDQKKLFVSQLCYVGLANKQMDNFVEASRCYEAALTELANHDSATFGGAEMKQDLIKNLTHNAKKMQAEAKEWFGTTGEITGWNQEVGGGIFAEKKCASCGGEGIRKCSACRLVCYCNKECQASHWKKAHKYACLGKSRPK